MTTSEGGSGPSVCGLTETHTRQVDVLSIHHPGLDTGVRAHLSAAVDPAAMNVGVPGSMRGAATILLGTNVGRQACTPAFVLML